MDALMAALVAGALAQAGDRPAWLAAILSDRYRSPLPILLAAALALALASALATFGKTIRANIDQAAEMGDQDTADIFTEVSRGIDKNVWFVEAHIQASR